MKKIVCLILLCLVSSLASAETFYRWKDDQGATHYTTAPPQGRSSTSLEVETGVTSEQPVTTAASNLPATPAAAPAKEEEGEKTKVATYKERCDQYRKNLKLLQSGNQLTTKGEDGKLRSVTAEDRAKMEANAKQMLTACPPDAK